MDSNKPLKFHGGAGGFFLASIVSWVMWYVIIIGWPIAFNYMNQWIVENLEVNGRRMKYTAKYTETLGFLLVNIALIIVTLGIYTFWFVPKAYRFVVDHSEYTDAPSPSNAPQPAAPVAPSETPSSPAETTSTVAAAPEPTPVSPPEPETPAPSEPSEPTPVISPEPSSDPAPTQAASTEPTPAPSSEQVAGPETTLTEPSTVPSPQPASEQPAQPSENEKPPESA
jgi:cytoskeletal protein RodZ